MPKFEWGGAGYAWVVKTQSAKIWPTFHWGGGGVFLGSQIVNWYSWQNEQNFAMRYTGGPCIADSLSHTTVWRLMNAYLCIHNRNCLHFSVNLKYFVNPAVMVLFRGY